MTDNKISVQVNLFEKDGRVHFEIHKSSKDLDLEHMRRVLMGGLCLLIRAEDDVISQGVALREVIEYLQRDFVNVDSFNDIKKNFD